MKRGARVSQVAAITRRAFAAYRTGDTARHPGSRRIGCSGSWQQTPLGPTEFYHQRDDGARCYWQAATTCSRRRRLRPSGYANVRDRARDAGLDFAKPLDLKEVADLPLILPSRPNTFRLFIEKALSEQRLPLKIAAEINTPKLIVAAVEAGLGFGVLAYCASHSRLTQREVSVAPIREQMVSWSIIHSRESPLSRAGKLMQELFVSIARNRIDSKHWRNASLPSKPEIG